MSKNIKSINKKNRALLLILYPQEDESHKKALEYIQSHFKHCFIVHDKDTDENGELKKSHIHCIIYFPNARYINSVADELGITPNYIQVVSDLDSSLLYLVHYDNTDKYQYDISEVKGPLKNKLIKLLNNEKIIDTEDAILSITDYIDNSSILTIHDIVFYTCRYGLYGYYRQSAYIVNELIKEHNADYKLNDVYNLDINTGELTPTNKKEVMK